MNLKSTLASILGLITLASSFLFAQALPQDPEDEITHLYGNNYALMWQGHAGNTYFIQTSTGEVSNGSLVWEYVPDIRFGTGQPLGMGFEVLSDPLKRFYRLQYTNQPVVIDHNLDDFDGDGFTNLEEAQDNTDPLDASNYPTTGGGGGGSSSDEDEDEDQEFELIHIVDGVSESYSFERGDSIPVFEIFRAKDLTNELKLVSQNPDAKLTFLQKIPNEDWDPSGSSDPTTNPKWDIDVIEITPSSPWFYMETESDTYVNGELTRIEIVPADGQAGTTGDLIPSQKRGSFVKHYVSPKKSTEIPDDFVVLKIEGDIESFQQDFEWVGGEAHPSNPLMRRVKRDNTGKVVVRVRKKNGGPEADLMNVWVVWTEITKSKVGKLGFGVGEENNFPFAEIDKDKPFQFVFKIVPQEIITEIEVPKLDRAKRTDVPGVGKPFPTKPALGDADSARFKWDVSRQKEVKIVNDALVPEADLDEIWPSAWVDGQPAALVTPINFPADPVEGNDDPAPVFDEETNTYIEVPEGLLARNVGELSSIDLPKISFDADWGVGKAQNDDKLEIFLNYKEFSRVELWDGRRIKENTWFRISDHKKWHFALRLKFQANGNVGVWTNNSTATGLGHLNPNRN